MPAHGVVIVLDPKGGRGLLLRSKAEASRHGKPFALFAPAFRHYSVLMNPLATATDALEVGHRIQALIPASREEIWYQFPLALIVRLAEAQQAVGVPWTLEGLYRVSVIRRRMEALIYHYLCHLGYFRPPAPVGDVITPAMLRGVIEEYYKQGGDDLTADALIEDANWPAEHYRKMTTSLVPTFRGVVGGKVGPMLSPPPGTGLTWDTIVQQGMVVYFALTSMLIGDVANRIGRIFLQDLIGYAGYRLAYHDPATMTPITVIMDDAADILYLQSIDALNKARAANIRFILAMQSHADPEAMMGAVHARRVWDNLGSRIVCGLADEQTAIDLTKGLTCTVELPDTKHVGVGYGGVGGLSGNVGTGLKPTEVPLLRPSWLTALPIGEAFARIAGLWWKVRFPLLEPVSPALRDALGLTAMWEEMDPNRIYKGDVCDTVPLPTVPPERWLPAPSRQLPSPDATRRVGKSTSTPSWPFSQAIRRAWRFVSAMGRRRAQR